jgi:L-fuconolactonase
MIIDSHCHVSNQWYEPVETLLFQMDRHGVDQAVLVQMLGQTDNRYQQDCVRRYPDRFVSAVLVDTSAPDACAHLCALAAEGARGVRLRPATRSGGDDPLAIWRTAAACSLAVSCVGASLAFADPAFEALLAALPALHIVLEHLGGSSRPDADDAERTARRRVFEYARYPNVFLKLPGLGELAQRVAGPLSDGAPFTPKRPAVLDEALAAFGPERLMWGSDFPPVAAREGYANALRWAREAVGHLTEAEQASIFGGVALQVFGPQTMREKAA